MCSQLSLVEMDEESARSRAAFNNTFNRIWPRFALSDREFEHGLTKSGPARRWIVYSNPEGVLPQTIPGGDGVLHETGVGGEGKPVPDAVMDHGFPVGVLVVERMTWSSDDEPPIAFLLLEDEYATRENYLWLLHPVGEFAREHGFDDLRVLLWEDEDVHLDLLGSLDGWQEIERDHTVSLDLKKFKTGVHWKVMDMLELPAGIKMATLAERPDLTQEAHDCYSEAVKDIPGSSEQVPEDFDDWIEEFEGPKYRLNAVFLAIKGDRVIGISDLEFSDTSMSAWHGFTGVRREWRNRGIATYLKSHAIRHAVAIGLSELSTENESRNIPMRHINAKLGFEPTVDSMLYRGPISSFDQLWYAARTARWL